jgi:hypothetical protein
VQDSIHPTNQRNSARIVPATRGCQNNNSAQPSAELQPWLISKDWAGVWSVFLIVIFDDKFVYHTSTHWSRWAQCKVSHFPGMGALSPPGGRGQYKYFTSKVGTRVTIFVFSNNINIGPFAQNVFVVMSRRNRAAVFAIGRDRRIYTTTIYDNALSEPWQRLGGFCVSASVCYLNGITF